MAAAADGNAWTKSCISLFLLRQCIPHRASFPCRCFIAPAAALCFLFRLSVSGSRVLSCPTTLLPDLFTVGGCSAGRGLQSLTAIHFSHTNQTQSTNCITQSSHPIQPNQHIHVHIHNPTSDSRTTRIHTFSIPSPPPRPHVVYTARFHEYAIGQGVIQAAAAEAS